MRFPTLDVPTLRTALVSLTGTTLLSALGSAALQAKFRQPGGSQAPGAGRGGPGGHALPSSVRRTVLGKTAQFSLRPSPPRPVPQAPSVAMDLLEVPPPLSTSPARTGAAGLGAVAMAWGGVPLSEPEPLRIAVDASVLGAGRAPAAIPTPESASSQGSPGGLSSTGRSPRLRPGAPGSSPRLERFAFVNDLGGGPMPTSLAELLSPASASRPRGGEGSPASSPSIGSRSSRRSPVPVASPSAQRSPSVSGFSPGSPVTFTPLQRPEDPQVPIDEEDAELDRALREGEDLLLQPGDPGPGPRVGPVRPASVDPCVGSPSRLATASRSPSMAAPGRSPFRIGSIGSPAMGLPEPALAETEESKRSPIFTKAGATGLVWGNEFPVEATLRLVTGPDDTKPVLVHARNANWDRWLGPGGQSSLRVDGLEVLTLSTVDPTGPVTIQVEYADGNGSRTLTLPVPDSLNPTA